jgi:hypothetical protein
MISPKEVVEEMSFCNSHSPPQKKKPRSPLRPLANPPSCPPPPAPATPPSTTNGLQEQEQQGLLSSYQSPYQYNNNNGNGNNYNNTMNNNGTNTRAATMPTIHHYNGNGDEEDPQTQYQYNVASTTINTSSAAGGFRGDASWRPNTGETNVYDTAIFGLALHELLDNLALTNVCAGAATCLLLAATWFFKLLALRNLVLSCYLAFFGFTLLSVELLHMFRIDRGYFMSIQTQLRSNFGLLYHPPGKIVFCYLLASLCWGIGGIYEFVLGWVYFGSASILLYVWASYPEYRRLVTAADDNLTGGPQQKNSRSSSSNSWSNLVTSNPLSSFSKVSSVVGEATGLLDAASSSMRQQHSGSGAV